jgi:hypothetical protein
MKRKLLLASFCLFSAIIITQAQNKSLGVGTAAPNPNAALHVESPTSNQGFIMPRLTTAQRTAMSGLLTSADNGLMLYDTDLGAIYIWDGATWKRGAKLGYPYADSITTTTGTNDLFKLQYNNAETKRVMRLEQLNTSNAGSTLSVRQLGTGIGGYFQVSNASTGGTAVYGTTNSNVGGALAPVGVYGESTGTGSVGGSFRNTNTSNTYTALYAETAGTGPALSLNVSNASNTAPALNISHAGTGYAISADGTVSATSFIGDGSGLTNIPPISFPFSTTQANASTLFDITNSGTGYAGNFQINNAANSGPALNTTTNGTGAAIRAQTSTGFASIWASHDGAGNAIQTETTGTGSAAKFVVNNAAGTSPALWAETNSNQPLSAAVYGLNTGTGDVAASFKISNASNTFPALYTETNGTGRVATFNKLGTTGSQPAVFINSQGGHGLWADHNGATGYASIIQNINTANSNAAMFIEALGSGPTLFAQKSTDGLLTGDVILAEHLGTSGAAGNFIINNASHTGAALEGATNGTGPAISGENSGSGNGFAGFFQNTNAANSYPAIQAKTAGTGTGVRVIQDTGNGGGIDVYMSNGTSAATGISVNQQGTGTAASFDISNGSSTATALFASTNGSGGQALSTYSTGNARAAYFQLNNNLATIPAVTVTSNGSSSSHAFEALHTGTGDAVYAEATTGSAGNFAVTNGSNPYAALTATTNSATGTALTLMHGAGGNALEISAGGVRLSTFEVTSGNSIATRAAAYRVTGGSSPFTFSFSSVSGDVFLVYNETAGPITVAGVSIPVGEGRTIVNFSGNFRGF